MTEENKMADIRQEGEDPFKSETEDDSASSPEEKKEKEDAANAEAAAKEAQQKKEEDSLPFHKHPRWKEREEEYNKRFNDQETRHQDEIRKLREEFGTARKENAEQTKIPSWFGGTQEQWDAYRTDRDAEIKLAEERAYERVNSTKSAEEKAVKEATDYMQSEMSSIENDKDINPSGIKIDPNKLLKIVMDNDLVDSKGRWNYRAGWRIYAAQENSGAGNKERKNIAGISIADSKGELKPATFKTSADFKKDRPW